MLYFVKPPTQKKQRSRDPRDWAEVKTLRGEGEGNRGDRSHPLAASNTITKRENACNRCNPFQVRKKEEGGKRTKFSPLYHQGGGSRRKGSLEIIHPCDQREEDNRFPSTDSQGEEDKETYYLSFPLERWRRKKKKGKAT